MNVPSNARTFFRSLPAITIGAGAQSALAHAKWFHDSSDTPIDPPSILAWPVWPFVVAAFAVVMVAAVLWRLRGGRGFLPSLERFGGDANGRGLLQALLPLVLAVHVSVPLLIYAVQGTLFAPSNVLPGAWAYLFGTAGIAVALAFLYGVFTRFAAFALAGLWAGGVLVLGAEAMLENAHVLGFAAFFALAGRGRWSVDRLLLPLLEPRPGGAPSAFTALRVGLGVSLVVAAFTEKLANVPLGEAFLVEHALNFTSSLGFPIPDALFVIGAGTVELVIGLLLIFGFFHREALVLAWLPFNLTVTVFSWTELLGHLPFYGTMFVLLAYEASAVSAAGAEARREAATAAEPRGAVGGAVGLRPHGIGAASYVHEGA